MQSESLRPESSATMRGFTLVEMLLAVVIIGIGVAGVLMAFNSTVKGSVDPVVTKQLLALAEEMMEEIELKPMTSDMATTKSGCSRAGYTTVGAYHAYETTNQICNIDGELIAGLTGYSMRVDVVSSAIGGLPSSAALKIIVKASRGSEQVSLVSWRTNYTDATMP